VRPWVLSHASYVHPSNRHPTGIQQASNRHPTGIQQADQSGSRVMVMVSVNVSVVVVIASAKVALSSPSRLIPP
jgi:hypothetical protein